MDNHTLSIRFWSTRSHPSEKVAIKIATKVARIAVRVYYYLLKYKVSSQALALDDDGLYTERVETLLTRLQLRGSIYATPGRAEDIAAMIIEQVRSELLMVREFEMVL